MRKIFTLALASLLGATITNAQTVATFDTLTLVGADTFYVNYTNPGNDVGFDDGLAHFETYYDTTVFSSLRSGFVYTNMTDSVDGSYTNPNSAITAEGYNSSAQYVVGYGYEEEISVKLKGAAIGNPVKGFYITNTTYAYKSMLNGDAFAKKFGGVPNVDSDWFKVTIKGYLNGTVKMDSVDFYLADFRFTDSTKDYIVNTWEWVDLMPLGNVDSLTFLLTSSDVGSFGINTPTYFAIDNFETYETVGVKDAQETFAAKVYPNPATDNLYIELNDNKITQANVLDVTGKVVASYPVTGAKTAINIANLTQGVYILHLQGSVATQAIRFVKQ